MVKKRRPFHVPPIIFFGLLLFIVLLLAGVIYFQNLAAPQVAEQNVVAPSANQLGPGSKIVFVGRRPLASGQYQTNIYVMNTDGTGIKRITNDTAREIQPVVSPDKSLIAYATDKDGNYEIYTMSIDGSNKKRLTNNPGNDFRPVFSPDGTKILYLWGVDSSMTKPRIKQMNTDGSNQSVVMAYNQNGMIFYNNADYAGDMNKIAFVGTKTGSSQEQIYIKNLANGDLKTVTNSNNKKLTLDVSTDGTKIVFAAYDGLYSVNTNGTNLKALWVPLPNSNSEIANPRFSPNDQKIIFNDRDNSTGNFHSAQIQTINADGSGLVNITGGKVIDTFPVLF